MSNVTTPRPSLLPSPVFPISHPVLYVALCLPENDNDDTDPVHWSLLVGPTFEVFPPDVGILPEFAYEWNTSTCPEGLLYTYTPHSIPPKGTRVWKYTTEEAYHIRAAFPADCNLIARLCIAEVESVETLTAHLEAWSPKEVPLTNFMSLNWLNGILDKLDIVDREADEKKSGKAGGRCLGLRMKSFESVEQEGRQYINRVKEVVGRMGDVRTAMPRLPGQSVPTSTLFDRGASLARNRTVPSGSGMTNAVAAGLQAMKGEEEWVEDAGKEASRRMNPQVRAERDILVVDPKGGKEKF